MGFYNPRFEKNIVSDRILKWVADIVTVIVVALFLLIFLGEQTKIIGNSMADSLENGQVVLINRMVYKLSDPSRFDVVVYKSKTDEGKYVIKRIIGLPGETIKIEDSKIYVDGELLKDEYFDENYESGYVSKEMKIGSDEYFVMGDNRNLSEDSRFEYIGNIKEDDIVGKAWLIVSPFKEIGFIR